MTVTSGVRLAALGRVERVDLERLAEQLSARYRIPVGTLPDVALPRSALDAHEGQLIGNELLRALERSYAVRGRSAVIGVTDHEMSGDVPSVFSWRNVPPLNAPYGVVSTADLGATLFARLRGHTRHERTRKLIARNIGFLSICGPRSRIRTACSGPRCRASTTSTSSTTISRVAGVSGPGLGCGACAPSPPTSAR